MNYADDRLDRRARFEDGDNSLWKDFCRALGGGPTTRNHELLGRTLRDVGWNRHAAYHYAVHWCEHDASERACGDFCQMCEFAGFPEVGVLALLAFRRGFSTQPGRLLSRHQDQEESSQCNQQSASGNENSPFPKDESWLLQPTPPQGDCGCRDEYCGRFSCFLPLPPQAVDAIVHDLRDYHHQALTRQVLTSGQILNYQAGKGKLMRLPEPDIPTWLQFWKHDAHGECRALSPLLQMLLIKLLYVCMPQLATEAVCHANISGSPSSWSTSHCQTNGMDGVNEKSHRAYFVLIRAVVLGQRVKSHRKQLHTPVWEQCWHPKTQHQLSMKEADTSTQFFDSLQQWTRPEGASVPSPLCWLVPNHLKAEPIFLVGDSHVLSLAWQMIEIPTELATLRRQVVPVVITGLKAWHVRPETRFFTRTNLVTMLRRLPTANSRTILFSVGEIDCREGFGGPKLQGYENICSSHVKRTVAAFSEALVQLSRNLRKQVLVLPVAPHGYRKTGRVSGQQSRRETMRVWNEEMSKVFPLQDVYFLDYVNSLLHPDEEGFVLNPLYNADGTHMNSGFGALLANAIVDSGCDTERLQ